MTLVILPNLSPHFYLSYLYKISDKNLAKVTNAIKYSIHLNDIDVYPLSGDIKEKYTEFKNDLNVEIYFCCNDTLLSVLEGLEDARFILQDLELKSELLLEIKSSLTKPMRTTHLKMFNQNKLFKLTHSEILGSSFYFADSYQYK